LKIRVLKTPLRVNPYFTLWPIGHRVILVMCLAGALPNPMPDDLSDSDGESSFHR
jgi:hypothetical protein